MMVHAMPAAWPRFSVTHLCQKRSSVSLLPAPVNLFNLCHSHNIAKVKCSIGFSNCVVDWNLQISLSLAVIATTGQNAIDQVVWVIKSVMTSLINSCCSCRYAFVSQLCNNASLSHMNKMLSNASLWPLPEWPYISNLFTNFGVSLCGFSKG
jgi:hypothetical protein